MALRTLYGPPEAALRDASVKNTVMVAGGGNDFDDDEPVPQILFRPAQPDFTVTRSDALYLLAPRDQIVRELRARRRDSFTCVPGKYIITIAHGSSDLTRRARNVLRVLQDTAATAAVPLAVVAADQQAATGIGGHIGSLGSSLKSVFTLKAFDVVPMLNSKHVTRQEAMLKDSVVQISAARSTAFMAAAPDSVVATSARLDELAERLVREFGF